MSLAFPLLIAAALAANLILLALILRSLKHLETRPMITPAQQTILDAEAAEATRIAALITTQAARIADLEAKLAADDAASNDMAAQLAALKAAGDGSDFAAAVGGFVTTLQGIGVAPPAPAPAPVADPVTLPTGGTPPAAA